jgi:hypothetical protein
MALKMRPTGLSSGFYKDTAPRTSAYPQGRSGFRRWLAWAKLGGGQVEIACEAIRKRWS